MGQQTSPWNLAFRIRLGRWRSHGRYLASCLIKAFNGLLQLRRSCGRIAGGRSCLLKLLLLSLLALVGRVHRECNRRDRNCNGNRTHRVVGVITSSVGSFESGYPRLDTATKSLAAFEIFGKKVIKLGINLQMLMWPLTRVVRDKCTSDDRRNHISNRCPHVPNFLMHPATADPGWP